MKLLLKLALGLTLFAGIMSCKDDNDANPEQLAGTWAMTDLHTNNGISTTSIAGQTITSTFTNHGTNYNTQTIFTENPNEFTSTGSYTLITTLSVQGQTTTDTTNVDAFQGTGEWSIDGNTLTQIYAGDTTTLEILELSDNKLRLKDDLDETVVDPFFGSTIRTQAEIFTTFERQ